MPKYPGSIFNNHFSSQTFINIPGGGGIPGPIGPEGIVGGIPGMGTFGGIAKT